MDDLIIIGAGPAGLTAAIYSSCYHLSYKIIGKEPGGQQMYAPQILNYPGFSSISGKELTERMVGQVKGRGGELVTQSVTRIKNYELGIMNDKSEYGFELETQNGDKYQTKSIILATGTERRKLNIPGEVEYTAKGVHYCATCEKLDYEGKVCVVVGGANSAVQSAVELAQAANRIYIIYRGQELRGDAVWLDQVKNHPNIEVIYNTEVMEILGDGERVTGIKMKQLNNETIKQLNMDKIFIEIGGVPGTALVIPMGVKMDAGGFIRVNDKLETNVGGVFAAGDLVSYGLSIEQISSAVGLGARAAASAFAYLKGEKAPSVWGESQIRR